MCFSAQWLEQMLIYIVVVCGIIAIIKLLIPLLVQVLTPVLGGGAVIVGQIMMIVLYVIIAIFVIYLVFGLISCLWSFVGGGGGLSLIPHR